MPYDGARIRWRAAALGLAGALQVASASGAEPAKEVPTRRGYDFTRPEPGAILPNPTEGVGTPPQLREYVTVHAMADDAGQPGVGDAKAQPALGGTGPPAPGSGTGGAPRQPARPPEQQSTGQAAPAAGGANPPAGGATPPSGAAANGKAPSAADYVQKALAEQVAARGVAGPFTYRPSPLAAADPARLAEERTDWNSSVGRLASSWQGWQASHRAAPDQRTAGSSGMSEGQAAPGRIILSGAPASVTGDLTQPAP